MAKARKKASKRRSKAKKNPALISAKELGYFYEDGIRDFNRSSLVGQNLSGMDLRGASFRDANLYSVNFSGADLRGVDFRGADLGDTDFRGAKVDMETVLEGVNIEGSKGPPEYYSGDTILSPEEMFGTSSADVGVAPFSMQASDEGYVVAVAPSSGMADSIKPEVFNGPNGKMEAVERARLLNRELQEAMGEQSEQVEVFDERGYIGELRKEGAPEDYIEVFEEGLRGTAEHVASGRVDGEEWGPVFMTATWYADSKFGGIGDSLNRGLAPSIIYHDGSWFEQEPGVLAKGLDPLRAPISKLEAKRKARDLFLRLAPPWPDGDFHKPWPNPRQAKAKKPHWKLLLDISQHLWETYDDKPLKRNLVNFGVHSMAMKEAKSVKVRAEGARAHRAYKREMKVNGWKEPKIVTRTSEEFEGDIRKARAKGAKKPAKKKAKKPRRNPRRVSKAKLIAGLNETLDEFRKSEKKLMEESGISYRDPLADTVIREEGRNVMLHFDGAGYDYLSVNSDYESTLRQDVFDKAESLGWEGDDYSCYAMEFFAR